MNLRILLPFEVFAEKTGVSRIVAETRTGSLASCPTDSIASAALKTGILTYESRGRGGGLRGR